VFLATDIEVRVRFPALPDFLRSSGFGTGSTQPRECNWGAPSENSIATNYTWRPWIKPGSVNNRLSSSMVLVSYSSAEVSCTELNAKLTMGYVVRRFHLSNNGIWRAVKSCCVRQMWARRIFTYSTEEKHFLLLFFLSFRTCKEIRLFNPQKRRSFVI
jgi:hypothetical protein